jgi:(E)-4-hydroxy-3-methylbut-2-enyl-diphosphate synthase
MNWRCEVAIPTPQNIKHGKPGRGYNNQKTGLVADMNQPSPIKRRVSRQIMVGKVPVGGDAPIAVQSMTNTETCDVEATVGQVNAIADAGADIVRVSVPSMEAAEAFKAIRAQVPVPLVADIHFDHNIALKVAEYGVDCLRINPGNIGREEKVREVIAVCKDRQIPIRIGVNAGSLGKELLRKYPEPTAEALVESAMRNVDILDRHNFPDFKVSVKASEVFMAVDAYRMLATKIEQPLHLGITEAGALRGGTVKSAVGIGMLLMDGIGDTIRISLAADPVEEVKVGFEILKSLKLRANGINFIACPSCSRQNFDVIGTMNELERRLEDIRTPMDVAVIGCIVNGPGEAREADVGLTGATPNNLIYLNGEPDHKVSNQNFVDHLESVIRERAAGLEAARAAADANTIARSS